MDVESIGTDSVADLSELEDDRVTYEEETGALVIRIEEIIPPLSVPVNLPIVTNDEIYEKEITCIVREDLNRIKEIWDQCVGRSPPSRFRHQVLSRSPARVMGRRSF